MKLRTGLYTETDAGPPEGAGVIEPFGLHEPRLPGLQGGQRAEQLAVRWADERTDARRRLPGHAHRVRRHGVDELSPEALGRRDRPDEHHERRRRALLPGMAERRVDDVLRGEVEVGARRDDDRVLAAGLGEQR